MLLTALLVALLAPILAPYDPYATVRVTIEDIYRAPSAAHLLGTDDGGKDVLSSLLYGARVSLLVGFAAAAIALIIGGLVVATADGGLGSGNGLAGGVVAMMVGLIGMALGGLALSRSRRTA
jgi:peptide/nickel transport system permease protein